MHRITRNSAERERLEQAARTTRDKRAWLRMRALLLWDGRPNAAEVARTLGVGRQSLYLWRDRYLERRDPADLLDRPKPGRTPSLSEPQRARLTRILEHDPQELGYRSHGWTVPLLLTHLESHEGVQISATTLRRTLRALGYRWKRPRYVLARKDPEREGKKGSSAGAHPQSAKADGGALHGRDAAARVSAPALRLGQSRRASGGGGHG